MKKIINYIKKTDKKILVLNFLTVILCLSSMILFTISSRVGNANTHLNKQPLSVTLNEIKKSKNATWINNDNVLVSSVGERKASDVSPSIANNELAVLTNSNINIRYVSTANDIYPSARASKLAMVGTYSLLGGIVSAFAMGGCYYKRARKKENEEEREKAVAGDTNEAIIDYENPDTTFADVAGCDEAVSSLSEMADYLKYPERYQKMGVRIPKGAIMHGEAGNGKTLLARALAGEAKVPFFIANGSEFAEIYVGSGAKKVRELFDKVRKHKSAIVFIDEVDAIARKRSNSAYSGNTETESTLNQLLTEIDGFNNKNGDNSIIVIAATNRKDLLDPAITRSGRLERHIEIPSPDRIGREKILRLHSKNKPLGDDVDLSMIAWRTPGFSGADMETIVNEAGLIAIRQNKQYITQKHLDEAVADVAMGRARESAYVTPNDRTITAWHETGHALCAYLQAEHDDPVAVSIVPRGPAGGVTWMSGNDNIFMSRRQAKAKIVTAMGGRVAEEMFMNGEHTQGPSSDLQNATNIAYSMITKYGMTQIGFQTRDDDVSASNEKITAEVEELLKEGYEIAKSLLNDNKEFLFDVVQLLLEENNVSYQDIEKIANRHKIPHIRTMEYEPIDIKSTK